MGKFGALFTGVGREARYLGRLASGIARKTTSQGISAGWSALKTPRNAMLRRTLLGAGIGAGIGGVNAGIRGDNVLGGAMGGAGIGAAAGFGYNHMKLRNARLGRTAAKTAAGVASGAAKAGGAAAAAAAPTAAPAAARAASRMSRGSYWGGMSQAQKRTARAMSRSSVNLPLSQRLSIYKNNKVINRVRGAAADTPYRGSQTFSGSVMGGIPDWRMR